jgi:hypothetical protein
LTIVKSREEENDDYFSYFSSHENIILKPESTFKNLRSFLKHLPIDYYILLQIGYDKVVQTAFKYTNYIFLTNFPLLQRKKTYFKNSDPVKTVLFEDVYRCTERTEGQ